MVVTDKQTEKKYVKVEEEEKAADNVRLFLSVCASIQVYVNVCTRSVKGEGGGGGGAGRIRQTGKRANVRNPQKESERD